MPATFIDRHRTLTIWLSSLLLIGLVFINGLLLFQQLTIANPLAPNNPIASLPNGELLTSSDEMSDNSDFAWLPITVSVGGMLLFACILGGFNMAMIRRANQRDNRRRQDLQSLATAFETYYDDYGHYPVSSSYQEGYYRAILIPNEWKYYDLPSDEVIKTYLPQWPVSDPQISIRAKDQTGNYLYYPQQQGQSFSLYAVLERGTDDPVAQQDGLGPELDYYTYRLTSRHSQQTSPIPQPATAQPMPDQNPVLPVTLEATGSPLPQSQPSTSTDLSMPGSVFVPRPHEDSLPVIQASTLPLDVRLAQGTATEVQRLPEPLEPTPAESINNLPQPPTSQPMPTGNTANMTTIPPRRQLTFSQGSAVDEPKTADSLETMPPLFLGEEDLQ